MIKVGDLLDDTDNGVWLRVTEVSGSHVRFDVLDPETEEVIETDCFPLAEVLEWGYPRLT